MSQYGRVMSFKTVTESLKGNDGIIVSAIGGIINVVGSGGLSTSGNAGTATLTISFSGLTNHALTVGDGTGNLASLGSVGTTGQGLMGNTGADPSWTGSPTYSGTVTGASLSTSDAAANMSLNTNFITMGGTDANVSLAVTPKGTGNFVVTKGNLAVNNNSVFPAAPEMQFYKSTAGGAITTGDNLGYINWLANDGTGPLSTSLISSTSSGTIGAGRIASNLKFWTHPDSVAANPTLRMTIASTGEVTIASPDSGIGLTVYDSIGVQTGSIATANGNMTVGNTAVFPSTGVMQFYKSTAGGAITTGDILGQLKWFGNDGTGSLNTSSISSTSSGTVAAGRIASNLEFSTHPDSVAASPSVRMTIDPTGCITVAAPDSGTALTVTAGGLTVTAGTITMPVAQFGVGLVSSTAVGVLSSFTPGAAGQILFGTSVATNPTWTTLTIPGTVSKGDILVATADNTLTAVSGATTAGFVLTASGAGTSPTFQANAGGGIGTLAGDSGTATGATVTIAGGANLTSSATSATVTINLDAAISGTTSLTGANGCSLQTGTTAADTFLLQAYDVDGTAYVPFITLTANNTPTMDLATSSTIGSAYIYRAGGTDIPATDGGTGTSTNTQNGVLYGNGTSAIGATAEGGTGTVLIGTTSAAPSWLAAGTDGKVLTAHTGAAPTWETPASGGLTWSIITADQNAAVNTGYICNKAGLLTLTLPTTAAAGTTIRVTGMNTDLGWKVAQNANQIIHTTTGATTTGATGYISSLSKYDAVELVCNVANLEWIVVSATNNITRN